MKYEIGKTYQLRTGEILRVEKPGLLKLVVGVNGKIPDEDYFVEGPAENMEPMMDAMGAKEARV